MDRTALDSTGKNCYTKGNYLFGFPLVYRENSLYGCFANRTARMMRVVFGKRRRVRNFYPASAEGKNGFRFYIAGVSAGQR